MRRCLLVIRWRLRVHVLRHQRKSWLLDAALFRGNDHLLGDALQGDEEGLFGREERITLRQVSQTSAQEF